MAKEWVQIAPIWLKIYPLVCFFMRIPNLSSKRMVSDRKTTQNSKIQYQYPIKWVRDPLLFGSKKLEGSPQEEGGPYMGPCRGPYRRPMGAPIGALQGAL